MVASVLRRAAMATADHRHTIAFLLLKLEKKIAADLLKIDDCKERLRAISKETGEGFTEEVEGLGSVEVRAGRKAKLTGTCPELVVEAALAMPAGKLTKLIDSGLIKMVEVWNILELPVAWRRPITTSLETRSRRRTGRSLRGTMMSS